MLGEEALPFGKANGAAVVDETPLEVAPGLKRLMAVPHEGLNTNWGHAVGDAAVDPNAAAEVEVGKGLVYAI